MTQYYFTRISLTLTIESQKQKQTLPLTPFLLLLWLMLASPMLAAVVTRIDAGFGIALDAVSGALVAGIVAGILLRAVAWGVTS